MVGNRFELRSYFPTTIWETDLEQKYYLIESLLSLQKRKSQ